MIHTLPVAPNGASTPPVRVPAPAAPDGAALPFAQVLAALASPATVAGEAAAADPGAEPLSTSAGEAGGETPSPEADPAAPTMSGLLAVAEVPNKAPPWPADAETVSLHARASGGEPWPDAATMELAAPATATPSDVSTPTVPDPCPPRIAAAVAPAAPLPAKPASVEGAAATVFPVPPAAAPGTADVPALAPDNPAERDAATVPAAGPSVSLQTTSGDAALRPTPAQVAAGAGSAALHVTMTGLPQQHEAVVPSPPAVDTSVPVAVPPVLPPPGDHAAAPDPSAPARDSTGHGAGLFALPAANKSGPQRPEASLPAAAPLSPPAGPASGGTTDRSAADRERQPAFAPESIRIAAVPATLHAAPSVPMAHMQPSFPFAATFAADPSPVEHAGPVPGLHGTAFLPGHPPLAHVPVLQAPPGPLPVAGLAPLAVAVATDPGAGRVDVTLAPEELGRVQLQVVCDGGDLRVLVLAERSETLDLLRRNGAALASELADAGFGRISLDFAQGGPAGQDGRPAAPVADFKGAGTSPGPADPVPPAPWLPRTTATGRLDLRL